MNKVNTVETAGLAELTVQRKAYISSLRERETALSAAIKAVQKEIASLSQLNGEKTVNTPKQRRARAFGRGVITSTITSVILDATQNGALEKNDRGETGLSFTSILTAVTPKLQGINKNVSDKRIAGMIHPLLYSQKFASVGKHGHKLFQLAAK